MLGAFGASGSWEHSAHLACWGHLANLVHWRYWQILGVLRGFSAIVATSVPCTYTMQTTRMSSKPAKMHLLPHQTLCFLIKPANMQAFPTFTWKSGRY